MNEDTLNCQNEHVNKSLAEKINKEMPTENKLNLLADTFKVLGSNSRLKIIFALTKSEMCGQCLSELTGMTKSAISHQLRILKDMRLVKYRKEGKNVYYSLDDDHIQNLFNQGMEHVSEEID